MIAPSLGIEARRNLAPHRGSNATCQPAGILELAPLDALGHAQENVRYPLFEILGTQTSTKQEPNASRKRGLQPHKSFRITREELGSEH